MKKIVDYFPADYGTALVLDSSFTLLYKNQKDLSLIISGTPRNGKRWKEMYQNYADPLKYTLHEKFHSKAFYFTWPKIGKHIAKHWKNNTNFRGVRVNVWMWSKATIDGDPIRIQCCPLAIDRTVNSYFSFVYICTPNFVYIGVYF